MARIHRMLITDETAVYHIISRTVLEGYVIGEEERDFLVEVIKRLSNVYFVEVLGFCVMGDHFHLLVRMHHEKEYSDEEIGKRFELFHSQQNVEDIESEQILLFRKKWSSLSEYVREIKQNFSRFFNKRHNRKGFFWSERFKSVIVDEGETLINCLAYIDLNPVRAGLVKKPEDYPWCSLGYHVQSGNKHHLLSLDFGLTALRSKGKRARLDYYRKFLFEKVSAGGSKGKPKKGVELNGLSNLFHRNRYFSDSGIIGSKDFVAKNSRKFKNHFSSKHEKKPKAIKGLDGIYSLKRLTKDL